MIFTVKKYNNFLMKKGAIEMMSHVGQFFGMYGWVVSCFKAKIAMSINFAVVYKIMA